MNPSPSPSTPATTPKSPLLAGSDAGIDLVDPLAELLGARRPRETFHYGYDDVVKLSGHSCPTVAGAYLMTLAALRHLYPGDVPARGQIEVTVGGRRDDGSAGPMSQVVALLTGAAPETGFGGLMGRHRRRDLLTFDPALSDRIRFRRLDTGAAVDVAYDPSGVPAHPDLGRLLGAVLAGRATDEERSRFGELWQARVAAILAASHVVALEPVRT